MERNNASSALVVAANARRGCEGNRDSDHYGGRTMKLIHVQTEREEKEEGNDSREREQQQNFDTEELSTGILMGEATSIPNLLLSLAAASIDISSQPADTTNATSRAAEHIREIQQNSVFFSSRPIVALPILTSNGACVHCAITSSPSNLAPQLYFPFFLRQTFLLEKL